MAIDGASGSGKSTLSAALAQILDVALVPSDDFYAAAITDAEWDLRSPAQRAADAIDWRRLRQEALEPLLAGKVARWHPFDFQSGPRPDGTYLRSQTFAERNPKAIILLEGAYSCRPELSDLIDLSVLLNVPRTIRHQRLKLRETDQFLASWHKRWDEAEDYYFSQVKLKSSFDLIL